MKGQASYPFSMIEAAFTFLLVIGVAYGMQGYTSDFLKAETTDLRADRIENAASMMQYYNDGSMELDISGYEVREDSDIVYLRYDSAEEERDLSNLSYSGISGPDDFQQYSSICMNKTGGTLNISEGC